LHWAVKNKHYNVVELLLKHGSNINERIKQVDTKEKKKGLTSLHLASLNKDSQMVALLLAHNAKPTMYDKDNKAPVDYSIQSDDIATLKEFLKKTTIGNAHIQYLESLQPFSVAIKEELKAYQEFKYALLTFANDDFNNKASSETLDVLIK